MICTTGIGPAYADLPANWMVGGCSKLQSMFIQHAQPVIGTMTIAEVSFVCGPYNGVLQS